MKKILCAFVSAVLAVCSCGTAVSAKEAALKEGIELHGNMCGSLTVTSDVNADINVKITCETPDMPGCVFYDETIKALDEDSERTFVLEGNDEAVYRLIVSAPKYRSSGKAEQEQVIEFKVPDTDEITDDDILGYSFGCSVSEGASSNYTMTLENEKGEDKMVSSEANMTFAIADSVQGDANGDGMLNVRDCAAVAVALASGKVSELPSSADYNGDGTINVRDAAAVAKSLASGNK